MPALISAIVVNICYASVDACSGWLSKRIPALQLALWTAISAVVIFTIPTFLFYSGDFNNLTWANTAVMLSIGLLVNVGDIAYVRATRTGSVTISGVIGGSFPAVTAIVALVIFHETITTAQALGITAIVIGVALCSVAGPLRAMGAGATTANVGWSLLAMLAWGLYFALIAIPTREIGYYLPHVAAYYVGVVVFVVTSVIWRRHLMQRLRRNSHETATSSVLPNPFVMPGWMPLVSLSACLHIVGGILYCYGIQGGKLAVIAPIAGSSPAVFVLLSYLLFREKLTAVQWFGVATTVAGIITLSLVH